MTHRLLSVTAATAALLAVSLLAPANAFGQTASVAKKPSAAAKSWKAPRTPDGAPDLQGIWSNSTLTPLERPKRLGAKEFYTEAEFAALQEQVKQGKVGDEAELGAAAEQTLRYDLSLYGFDITKSTFASNRRTSLIVGPDGRVPAMLPQARKRNADRAALNKGHEFDSYENRPLSERCILLAQERIPMLGGANDNNELQILQGPGWVSLLHEINHDTRVIPTDGRPHIPQSVRQYQGDSVGHWDGDTLVVDTTNFMDLANFRGSGEKLHLIERFTRSAENTVLYQFTVEDPETWDKPWTAEVPMSRTEGPVYEWACHEGNTMISTILNGARVADAEAAKKAGK